MIESAEQARELTKQAQATDLLRSHWQDLYYTAAYLRGRGDDPFADSVWQELESVPEEAVAPPPQLVHRLRAQLEQTLHAQWQALYDGAVMLKEAGHDPFSPRGWEDLLAAKEAKKLDTLALTTHYLQPSLRRTQSGVLEDLIQVVRMLQDQGNDPLAPEEWERLLAPEKTPAEEGALIQVFLPRVTDILYTWLQKLDLTAQQFQAAGYAPFISDWRRLHQAIERRSLKELTAAIRLFPRELEEHIRLRIPYWREKATQLEPLREQLALQKNRNQATDLIAIYRTGLTKLRRMDRRGEYSLDGLHAMVLAILEVESSWHNLIAVNQAEARLAQRLRWATGGIIAFFLALVVVATAIAPRVIPVNEPIPLLGIPPSVILWSFIGSFVALLMRFLRRKFWEMGDFFKWFLARSLVGFIMGAVLYLVVVSGFFVFGVAIGSPSDVLSTLPRPEIFWLLAFAGASNDRIAEKVLSIATGRSVTLFESGSKSTNKAADESENEPELEKATD